MLEEWLPGAITCLEMIEIALYQPDIAPNTATIMRLGACLAVPVNVIEPAGFVWSDRAFRRAGMDYLERVDVRRWADWSAFLSAKRDQRIVLATTAGETDYLDHRFENGDVVLFGRESAGVPRDIHDLADCRITIAMADGARSLNVAVACAMVAGEALRQLR